MISSGMQADLRAHLRCVDCGATPPDAVLGLDVWSRDEGSSKPDEILEGKLTCGACGATYPIVNGVPRVLPADLRVALSEHYPEFFATNRTRLETVGLTGEGFETEGMLHVMRAFGYEWNEFDDYSHENFEEWVDVDVSFFDGKFGLDAGCGAGRHSVRAHGYGARMIAMDLSPAVDAAQAKARMIEGIDVVQGDIFNPPFAAGTFDFIYSIGVIHHTPDPPRAFASLVPYLRQGGSIITMVYASGRPKALGVLAAIRKVSTRLPLPLTKALSWLAAAVDTVFPITAYRVLLACRVPKTWLDKVTPEHVRIYAATNFEITYTDWLDRLSYPYVHYYDVDDVTGWYARAGLDDVKVKFLGTYGVNAIGTVPT